MMRGDGFLFQRGSVWWAGYYVDGKLRRQSLHTTDAKVAEKKLQRLRQARDAGTLPTPAQRNVPIFHLVDDLILDLQLRGLARAPKAISHLKHIRAGLGDLQAKDLDTSTVQLYQQARKDAGAANATINRECELLRQAYRLAAHRTPPKVKLVPLIPLLRVQNARQGFTPKADFLALLKHMTDPDVVDYLEWFWWTGMRPKEIRQLSWPMLDRETWSLNLDPKADKGGKGRVIPVEGPLRAIINRRIKQRHLGTNLIFHRVSKGQPGQPIKEFYKQWRNALAAAGLPPGLLPYDLRRTALRNMVRGGTDYTVAMKISGHRTRATFDRYNITSEEDLQVAIRRTATYVEGLPGKRKVVKIVDKQRRT